MQTVQNNLCSILWFNPHLHYSPLRNSRISRLSFCRIEETRIPIFFLQAFWFPIHCRNALHLVWFMGIFLEHLVPTCAEVQPHQCLLCLSTTCPPWAVSELTDLHFHSSVSGLHHVTRPNPSVSVADPQGSAVSIPWKHKSPFGPQYSTSCSALLHSLRIAGDKICHILIS